MRERGGGDAADGSTATTVLVAGTASHVGKSTVVAGLCRRLADRGVDVAPFKAQNMSNNARVALAPDGGWGEVGVSQHTQARAARVPPSTDHNPVLLKPRGDGESQLVVDGDPVGTYAAGEYYDEHWGVIREAAARAHARLAAEHDVVVAEGAGSIAEINLHDRDLANVETARFADANVVVVGDVERGGVFASLYGTLELMPDDVRERVVGTVVSKFRGNRSILEPGVDELEARTGVPVLGVLPYDDPGLPEEDSLGIPDASRTDGTARGPGDVSHVIGDDDGVPEPRTVTVGVVRLPRISNFTDFGPLARTPGVRVAYIEPERAVNAVADVHALVLPGTKNTVDDLHALRDAGFERALDAFDGPILGVCGGYQLLGDRITNAAVEGIGDADVVDGFGVLPGETAFSTDKRVEAVAVPFDATGYLDAGAEDHHAAAAVEGYEIHMGETTVDRDHPSVAGADVRPLGQSSVATDRAVGTYLHGLFENRPVRDAFVDAVYAHAGRTRTVTDDLDADPFAAAAALVAELDGPFADDRWTPVR
ncbi:cobyric acid synthase [Halorubellus sp. PRR65]|uniref:cobyric acid synthase n=1 Tax=Halorubellus sp. PRR65 TaxID=3098148 RepID=UPI002B256B7B|nr:cobyric acid synthase [Halorubellus sp. PRR65]